MKKRQPPKKEDQRPDSTNHTASLGLDVASLAPLIDRIRGDLLDGRRLRVIDYPRDTRPFIHAALVQLQDELPIRTAWATIDESRLNDTRHRARVYWIAGGHLHALREGL